MIKLSCVTLKGSVVINVGLLTSKVVNVSTSPNTISPFSANALYSYSVSGVKPLCKTPNSPVLLFTCVDDVDHSDSIVFYIEIQHLHQFHFPMMLNLLQG